MLRNLVLYFLVLALLSACAPVTPTAIETVVAQPIVAQGQPCPKSSEAAELIDGSVFICLDFAAGNFWQQIMWPPVTPDPTVEPSVQWSFAPGVEGVPEPQLDFWPSGASNEIYYYSESADGEQMWSFVPVIASGASLLESLFASTSGTVVVVEASSLGAQTATAAAAGVTLSPIIIIGTPVVGLLVLCVVASSFPHSEELTYYQELARQSIEAQAMKPHRIHSSDDHSPYVSGTFANTMTNALIDRSLRAKAAVASGASNGGWDGEPPVCGAYVDANGFVRRVWWWIHTLTRDGKEIGVMVWAYVYNGLPGNFGGAFDSKFKNALKTISPDLADRGWKVKIYGSCGEAEFGPEEFNPPPR